MFLLKIQAQAQVYVQVQLSESRSDRRKADTKFVISQYHSHKEHFYMRDREC